MENSEIEKRSKVILSVILLANLVRYTGVSIIQIGLPSFILNLSGSLISYGFVIGVFNITQSAFQFPVSTLSDKFSRKIILVLALSVYIIGTFLCYIATNIVELMIYRAIQGAGAYSSILQAVVADMYRKEEQGKGMALYSLTISLGYFAGTAIGGYFTYFFGFRSVFLITGVLATTSAILVIIFYKSPKKLETKNDSEDLLKPKLLKRMDEIKVLLKDSQFQYAVLLNIIRWMLFGAIVSYLIWVLEVEFRLNSIETSYLLIINVAIYTIFLLVAGKFVDKYGARKMLMLSYLSIIIFGFLFIVVAITGELMIYAIASLLNALFFGIVQTSNNTMVLQKIDENNPQLKGAGLGFSNSIGFIFSALGPIILSILDEIDIYLPYYFIMILMVPAFLVTFKLIKEP